MTVICGLAAFSAMHGLFVIVRGLSVLAFLPELCKQGLNVVAIVNRLVQVKA